MPHYAQGTSGWTKLNGYQALWDPKIDLGKFYFTTFQGKREETPYMTAENFARVIDILRNETPVWNYYIRLDIELNEYYCKLLT